MKNCKGRVNDAAHTYSALDQEVLKKFREILYSVLPRDIAQAISHQLLAALKQEIAYDVHNIIRNQH